MTLEVESSILGILLLLLLEAAFLATLSAFSFPVMFLCADIQKKVIYRGDKEEVLSWLFLMISFAVPWFFIARVELKESVNLSLANIMVLKGGNIILGNLLIAIIRSVKFKLNT